MSQLSFEALQRIARARRQALERMQAQKARLLSTNTRPTRSVAHLVARLLIPSAVFADAEANYARAVFDAMATEYVPHCSSREERKKCLDELAAEVLSEVSELGGGGAGTGQPSSAKSAIAHTKFLWLDNPLSVPKSGDARASDRKITVEQFLERVFKETGTRPSKKDIWRVADYKTQTDFSRWQRNHPRSNGAVDTNIRRVLSMSPHDFLARAGLRKGPPKQTRL